VRRQALMVPQQGVTRDPKGEATAVVVGPDNKVALRHIKVNRAVGNAWLIDSGLAAGERVIVEGLQKVRPGAAAAPVEAAPAPSNPANPAAPTNPAAAAAAAIAVLTGEHAWRVISLIDR
jgi:membrane fusion protein (multidrug efflux system)